MESKRSQLSRGGGGAQEEERADSLEPAREQGWRSGEGGTEAEEGSQAGKSSETF